MRYVFWRDMREWRINPGVLRSQGFPYHSTAACLSDATGVRTRGVRMDGTAREIEAILRAVAVAGGGRWRLVVAGALSWALETSTAGAAAEPTRVIFSSRAAARAHGAARWACSTAACARTRRDWMRVRHQRDPKCTNDGVRLRDVGQSHSRL